MILSIDEKIQQKRRELLKKQKEIAELRSEILSLEVLKRELCVPELVFEEEYFMVPRRIMESYFESLS